MSEITTTHADSMLDIIRPFQDGLKGSTELRHHINHSTRLMIRKGDLINNSSSRTGGISARAFHGGPYGFSSSPVITSASVATILKEADRNARLFATSPTTTLPTTGNGQGAFDYRSGKDAWSATRRVEFIKELDNYCSKTFSDLINTDLLLTNLAMEKALVTSDGADTYSYIPRCMIYSSFSIEAGDGTLVDLSDVIGGFGDIQDRFDDPADVFPTLDKLYARLREKADGIYAQAGYHDVVLDSDVAGILAHEAIGHTVEADIVQAGSVAGDYLNQQVASELITLVDGPDRGPDKGANLAIHIDDEGTPCRDITLIDKGVLKSFLHDKESAQHYGVEPTGNARAFSFSDEPLIRMRNTAITSGTSKLDDMIGEVEDGYYLMKSSNGQADSTSEFMFGITFGYEIKNGKLGKALRDVTIAGVAFDMLKTVTHVSDGISWSCGGMCGKKQPIPVGMGGPAIKCKINVGGR